MEEDEEKEIVVYSHCRRRKPTKSIMMATLELRTDGFVQAHVSAREKMLSRRSSVSQVQYEIPNGQRVRRKKCVVRAHRNALFSSTDMIN